MVSPDGEMPDSLHIHIGLGSGQTHQAASDSGLSESSGAGKRCHGFVPGRNGSRTGAGADTLLSGGKV